MSQMMEEMMKEAAQQAKLEVSRTVAGRMIEKGSYPIEDIAEVTGLSVDEVKLIAENKSA